MNQDLEAGALLREVTRLHVQLQRETTSCCGGTTLTQCTLITELGRNGSLTLSELGRRVDLDKSWTSRAVESLVQEGLLTKVPSQTDRRNVIISLFSAGEKRYTELNQTLNSQAHQVMQYVPVSERENVHHALSLLFEALQLEAKRIE
jgi:DNA-binding MarR family transcriptional regulator